MDNFTNIEGRDSFIKKFLHYTCPILGRTLLFYFPAYLYLFACSPIEEGLRAEMGEEGIMPGMNSMVMGTGNPDIPETGKGELDIFTFNDDRMSRLDSYQQYPVLPAEGEIDIDSRNGCKKTILCANARRDGWQWEEIQSYWHIGNIRFALENEDPVQPLSTQEIRFKAGTGPDYQPIEVIPFLSEIKIRSIAVDFNSPSYKGSDFSGIKVYLTNLNGEVSLTQKTFNTCSRIINHRSLKAEDMENFLHPETVFREIGDIPDGKQVDTDLSLYCFPNTCEEETLGSPFTRVVIEGKIKGKTWYYPITINREDGTGGGGVRRNCSYIYDITIRRSGSPDPDLPVDFGTMETKIETESWKTKEEYGITF